MVGRRGVSGPSESKKDYAFCEERGRGEMRSRCPSIPIRAFLLTLERPKRNQSLQNCKTSEEIGIDDGFPLADTILKLKGSKQLGRDGGAGTVAVC